MRAIHRVTLAIFRLRKVKIIATLLAFHLAVDKWVSVGKVRAIYIHLVKSSVSFWHEDWEQKWKRNDKWPMIASALLARTCLFQLWSKENFIHTVNPWKEFTVWAPLVFRTVGQKGNCWVSDLSSVSNVSWKNNLFLLLGKNKSLHPTIITLGTVCDSFSVRSYIKCPF